MNLSGSHPRMTATSRPARVVYFVRCEAIGLVKIGIAEDLGRRLAGLRGYPVTESSL